MCMVITNYIFAEWDMNKNGEFLINKDCLVKIFRPNKSCISINL